MQQQQQQQQAQNSRRGQVKQLRMCRSRVKDKARHVRANEMYLDRLARICDFISIFWAYLLGFNCANEVFLYTHVSATLVLPTFSPASCIFCYTTCI